jgi:anhydro-N-acetylmuramic acid kinase
MDSVDAAVVNLADKPTLLAAHQHPFPQSLRETLTDVVNKDDRHDSRIPELNTTLGKLFAAAVNALLNKANLPAEQIIAIGSHGQTISHHPEASPAYTTQIGDANIIAQDTRITTVADFRNADIKAGGQGAPLAPLVHHAFLMQPGTPRAIVNIGGIANVSFVSDTTPVKGFDTGPGNTLLDAWVYQHQQQPFDKDGRFARQGKSCPDLLSAFLADPYFDKPHPKSTGTDYFNLAWLEKHLTTQSPEDVQTTLVELTAQSIIKTIEQEMPMAQIYLCGGGARNSYLVQRIQALAPNQVANTSELGFDADYLEALLFAWLAKMRLKEEALNTHSITGAKQAVILGEIFSNPLPQPKN